MSQRRFAKLYKVSRTTVQRKLKFLAILARQNQMLWLKENSGSFTYIQFDDLETIEHTKCKPVTVTVVVDANSRKILGYTVAQIPAKGHLAQISREKYGRRTDHSRMKRRKLFEKLKGVINEYAEFHTDQHHDYPLVLKKSFPKSQHYTYKRKESSITGQGEFTITLSSK